MKKEKEGEQGEQFKIGRSELSEIARLTGYKCKMRTPATMKVIKAFLRTMVTELEKGKEVVLPNVGVIKLKITEPRFIENGILKNVNTETDGLYVHYRYKVQFYPSLSLKTKMRKASKKRFGEC